MKASFLPATGPTVHGGSGEILCTRCRTRPAPDRTVDTIAGLAGETTLAPFAKGDRQMPTVLSNILDRQFRGRATEPEVDCRLHLLSGPPKGWLYVSAVNDLFPPGGWLVNERRHESPVSCRRAVWRRGKPNALLHHSDQGSQYYQREFQRH
jgi:transposase InsO family protein